MLENLENIARVNRIIRVIYHFYIQKIPVGIIYVDSTRGQFLPNGIYHHHQSAKPSERAAYLDRLKQCPPILSDTQRNFLTIKYPDYKRIISGLLLDHIEYSGFGEHHLDSKTLSSHIKNKMVFETTAFQGVNDMLLSRVNIAIFIINDSLHENINKMLVYLYRCMNGGLREIDDITTETIQQKIRADVMSTSLDDELEAYLGAPGVLSPYEHFVPQVARQPISIEACCSVDIASTLVIPIGGPSCSQEVCPSDSRASALPLTPEETDTICETLNHFKSSKPSRIAKLIHFKLRKNAREWDKTNEDCTKRLLDETRERLITSLFMESLRPEPEQRIELMIKQLAILRWVPSWISQQRFELEYQCILGISQLFDAQHVMQPCVKVCIGRLQSLPYEAWNDVIQSAVRQLQTLPRTSSASEVGYDPAHHAQSWLHVDSEARCLRR